MPQAKQYADLRSLYFQALNSEDNPDCLERLRSMAHAVLKQQPPSTGPRLFRDESSSLSTHLATSLQSRSDFPEDINARLPLRRIEDMLVAKDDAVDEDRLRWTIAQLSPIGRIDGCHLAGAVSLKFARSESGAALLRSHSRCVGDGLRERNRALAFEQDAGSSGMVFAKLHTIEFANDPRIMDHAFHLPLFALTLAHFPTAFYPEILGFNLFMTHFNPVEVAAVAKPQMRFMRLRCKCEVLDKADACQAIDAFITSAPPGSFRRIEAGFQAAFDLTRQFLEALEKDLSDTERFSPQGKFLALLQRIGTAPFGYHKKGRMGGAPIDHWFDPVNFEPENVLKALASSPYIVPGNPEKSRLLTQITRVDGPMFRIFSDADLTIIADWIRSVPTSRTIEFPAGKFPQKRPPTAAVTGPEPSLAPLPRYTFNLRDLYFKLVNCDENIETWPEAKAFAGKWLASHAKQITKGSSALPFEDYSHAKLDAWLEAKHADQVESYKPLTTYPEEAKDDVVDMAVQLAPLTQIDGAWLRAMTSPSLVNTHIGNLLYHIYVDELGNGDITNHHGNIYAELVKSMGFDLPCFTTAPFSNDPTFDEDALEVPVFWLSISLFPRTYMPEILGLNLAMELSGVGGEYRRSGDVLRHYGFSAQFTELHNSIDNIVTGHTAWAADAIKAYFDDITQHGGQKHVADHWKRVWTGYRALQAPAKKSLIIEAISRIFDRLPTKRTSLNG